MLISRQEKLKLLIHNSTILNAQEREDWLALLELMNDKQLSELEGILAEGRPAPIVLSSPLAHITNLPQGIGLPAGISSLPAGEAGKQVSSKPMPSPQPSPEGRGSEKSKWMDGLKTILEEKELPAGRNPVLRTTSPKLPVAPRVDTKGTFSPVSPGKEDTAEWKPDRAESASHLSLSLLQRMGATHVTDSLRQLVKREGYLRVLEFLEQSPLYKAYLSAGRHMLESNSDLSEAGGISKQEFEQITDIFRKIQVN